MIKNVFFDLDDTIFDFHKAEHIALKKTLTDIGIEPKQNILDRYSVINLQQWKLLEKGELTRDMVKTRRYELLFNELGITVSPNEAAMLYESYLAKGHYFLPNALETLNALYGSYRLYLVSNGTSKVQWGRLSGTDLPNIFDIIFVSEDVGFNKPDKRYFDCCFSQIDDFKVGESVIIGDSLTSDIQGGINSGMTTIWFNSHNQQQGDNIVPDYTIDSLLKLPALLQSVGS